MRTPRPADRAPPPRHTPWRWVALIVASLGAVIVLALLLAPEFIDWNRYRDEIAQSIEQKLGRPVAIDGPLSLSLLPVPHLVAEKVRLGNIAGAADADFATAERLELRLHRMPLLTGQFSVASAVLVKPVIHLQRLADGRVNWRFAPAADIHRHGIDAEPQPRAFVLPGGTKGSFLQRVALRDGRIDLRLPRVGPVHLESVEADAQAQGVDGPFQFQVRARGGATAFAGEGSIGTLGSDETPVEMSLDLGTGAGRISIGGVLTGRDAATTLNGRLTIKAPHAGQLATLIGLGSAPDQPVEIRGPLVATVNEITAQSLTVDLPGASFSGFAALNLEGNPQLDLKLSTPRLDLAPWSKPDTPGQTAKDEPSPQLLPGAALASVAGLAFSPPSWLGTSIDLSAESVVWRGAVIRGARLNAQLANGEVTINQVGATLPGGSQINLFGFVDAVGGKPSFDGSFESGTDDLRGLLHWLKIDVDGVPADRLGAARFTGHLMVAPDRIRLDGADLRVDGTRVTTAVDLRLPAGANMRPALGASFAIDILNADAYRPRPTAAATPAATAAADTATPATAGNTDLGLGHWIESFDANIKGHVERLVIGGVTVNGIDLDGGLVRGALALRSLTIADIDGARGTASGTIKNLGGSPGFEALNLDMHADDPRRFLAAVGMSPPDDALGAMTVTGQLDGGRDALSIQGRTEVAGLVATVNGTVSTPLTAPRFDLVTETNDTSLTSALRLFGLDYRRRAGDQPVSTTFHLTGEPHKLTLDDLHLSIGSIAATGKAALTIADRSRLDVSLNAGDVPLDMVLGAVPGPPHVSPVAVAPQPPRPQPVAAGEPSAPQAVPRPPVGVGGIPERFSHAPIDLAWMHDWDGTVTLDAAALTWRSLRMAQTSAAMSLADGKMTLDHFTAKLWDGDISATAVLDSEGAVSCGVTLSAAQLKQAVLGVADLDLADGVLDASADLTTTGNSPAELIGRLAGTGKIAAHDGTLRGFDLKAASDRLRNPSPTSLVSLLEAGAKGGATSFSSLTGTVKASGGIFTTNDLTLTAEGGTMAATGAVNLPAYAMDARANLRLADAADAPPLVMRLSGPLDNPRRVLDINPLQTWLAQRGGKPGK